MQGHDFYAKKNILITGGLGFLGSNLAIRLVDLGASVRLYDGLIADLGGNLFNIEPVKEKVQLVIANIGDRSAMDQHVRNQDIIFNIGMHSCHLDSMENPIFDVQTNVVSQINFLESLRHNNPQATVVYIGTRAQYGRVENPPITEATPLNPMDIYSVSKQAVEWYHMLYSKICGLRPTSLRLGNTYGPRHQMRHAKYGVQNYLIRLALDGQQIQVFGDGSQKREMIYVDDVIECLLLLGERDQCIGKVYAIGTDERVTFLELVQQIINACGSGSYIHVPWPEDRKLIEVGDVVTDYSQLAAHTGWSPSTPLSQGLKITADYYRQYKEHYW